MYGKGVLLVLVVLTVLNLGVQAFYGGLHRHMHMCGCVTIDAVCTHSCTHILYCILRRYQ